MERRVPVEVISERPTCPDPGCSSHRQPADIYVRRISVTQLRSGWTVNGAGRTYMRMDHCPSCGMTCQIVMTHLPIELDGVPCPTCDRTTDFEYRLQCFETEAGEFSFTATVRCPDCSSKTFARRIADGIRRIKRLKLGPTGVEVDLE
jgi:DNA-directed RNA polymerase subunit RPC12/RpoP